MPGQNFFFHFFFSVLLHDSVLYSGSAIMIDSHEVSSAAHGNQTEGSRMLMPRLLSLLSIQEMPLPRKSSRYSNDLIN